MQLYLMQVFVSASFLAVIIYMGFHKLVHEQKVSQVTVPGIKHCIIMNIRFSYQNFIVNFRNID